MIIYCFKHHGLYKSLSSDGFILGAWDFYSEKAAKERITEWMSAHGQVVWVSPYWKDPGVMDAMNLYRDNWGVEFEGRCWK